MYEINLTAGTFREVKRSKTTLDKLYQRNLKQAIKGGFDHTAINCLCGCTDRKVVLSKAEAEAGRQTYKRFMADRLWDQFDGGWLFGSPITMLNIGMIPSKLAHSRLGLNRHNWHLYYQIY